MRNKNINNSVFLSLAIVILLGLSSCKKFLEPDSPSLFSTNTVYSSVTLAEMAVLGVYQDLAGDQGYGNRISCYYPYDNDETMGPARTGDNDRGDLAHYNATALNLQLYAPYLQLYQGIERANLCIYNIPKMSLYTSGSGQQIAELRRLYGEALTLRAQFYLELTRNWGDVPAQYLPSEVSTNLFIGKTNRDTIYNHLLADLKFAEDSLVPWNSQIASLTGDQADERITKGAVKALRARIALYRGGYELRQDMNIEREPDYKQFYQIAWNECNDIINSGEHALNPSYKSVFKDGICGHKLDNEILFQAAMGGATSTTDSKLGTYNGPKFGGTLSVKTTTSGSTTTTTATVSYTNGSATLVMLPSYFYMFDSSDTRRDVTFAPYDVMADYSKIGNKITAMRDGKFRCDWVTNPLPSTSANWGLNWPIIRYSDVLLMFAEADNELNQGPSAAAVTAYEQVRTRGYGGNHSLIGTTPTDYVGFFQAIVRERSLEFGAEGIRKYDLKRWGLLGTAISNTKTILGQLASSKVMSASSYMAPPPSYTITGPLPTSMYFYYPDSLGNPGRQSIAVDNSNLWANSLYAKQPSTYPAGTYAPSTATPIITKVSWIGSGIYGTATSTFSLFGSGFIPNHSELYPLPQAVLDASNGTLKQDYGY